MGILRTDKISGLETPTAVTGSVYFEGTGKALSFPAGNDFAYGTGDFTIECWLYPTVVGQVSGASYPGHIFFSQTVSGTNYFAFYFDSNGKISLYNTSSGGGSDLFTSAPDGSIVVNKWQHVALCRSGSTLRAFVDGTQVDSISNTFDFTNTDRNPTIGNYTHNLTQVPYNGYVSNFRILKGTALYTANFTVPTHELEVIGDTVLLCCNNPDSAGADGTGKTATVSGSAPASTVSPGLTRDFTSGTEFRGVTTFDTQGYFVPPSGTTEQRGRGRGLIGSGYVAPSRVNTIDYITIQSEGNAQDFGDLTVSRSDCANISSSTRGIFAGGIIGYSDVIDFVTIATTSNAVDFGDISAANQQMAGVSNSTRGLIGGGKTPASNPAGVNTIDYITIPTLGDAQDFGDLLAPQAGHFGTGSATRGIFAGGYTPADTNIIQYVTIASLGDALDFGDLTLARGGGAGGGNSIRGLFYAGYSAPALRITIDYITIASTGNAQDFGDASSIRGEISGCCSIPTRGVFSGGNPNTNTIEYVTIASTGDAKDFGDLTQARRGTSSLSDSHGGLS